ncbi:hypothetical protein AT15_00515 [Kosmotoga arenicorallina S304]|uniref:Uncharacterized protein n=1 Tax=Kosmotoga arenicorallina S304 TaxID=1453497 RepID=A0A176K0N7_9BACT|nr:hypothetical protein [Kosmotoga arenicorallina]OAA30030.1 hypothetical protein AT15_00515 [Kosmotoga arenicorallina S304]
MKRKNEGAILVETLLMFLASGVIAISLLGVVVNYMRMESRFYNTIRYTNAISRAFGLIDNDIKLLKKLKKCESNLLDFQIESGKHIKNIKYYFDGKILKRVAKENKGRSGTNKVVELRKGGSFENNDGLLTIKLDDFSITYNLRSD